MTEPTIAAMYETREAAESARDDLIALGLSERAISLHGTGKVGEVADADHKSFWASLGDMFVPDDDREMYAEGVRRGGYLLTVRMPADLEPQVLETLERSEPIDLDERAEIWRSSGWAGYQERTVPTEVVDTGLAPAGRDTSLSEGAYETPARASAAASGDEDVIHAAEEQLRVGKREVRRGSVRVRSYVTERPIEEQVNLREETIHVERRSVDRPVAAGDMAFQEKEIEAVERSEEAVVSKEARVTEEITLRKDVDTRTETVRDTVRKQEIEVEDSRTDVEVERTAR